MNELPPKQDPARLLGEQVSPDSLMRDFRGQPIISMLAVTVVVHIVLIGMCSVGYLSNQIFGKDNSTMSEEVRMQLAIDEATRSLRDIAQRHDISPQDLSDSFANRSAIASTKSRTPAKTDTEPVSQPTDVSTEADPKSAIEQDLEKKQAGPTLPELPSIDQEDDLFK